MLSAFPSAIGALRANMARSLLTALGIIIGVAAVIAIVALGEGASAQVAGQLAGLGVNVLTISPGSTRNGGVSSGAVSSNTLKASDATAIAAISGVSAVSPVVSGNAQVIAGSSNWSTRVQAVLPAYLTINAWTISQGAAFTLDDSTSSANVAVIGQTVYTSLFPNGQSPNGQSIQIRNVPFTVIGLLTAKGGNADDVLMIPFTTGQVRLFGSTSINEIVLQVGDAAQIPTVTTDITTLLRQLHRLSASQPADFSIQSNNDVISRVSGVTSTLTTLLGGVAAVSLVVGGIGIMNIMLVSVTERTHEIGIRLAIGGQPSDVMSQFLIEAVMLSVLGGLIGILLGSGVALALPYVAGWTTVFTVAGHPARVRCVGHHRHVLRDLSGAQGVIARSDYRAPLRIDSARNEETTRMIVHSRVFHRAALALAILFAVLSPGAALAQSDPRSFSDTGFTISDDAIWSFFTQYGGTSTFGEPISREFVLIGTPAQLFQNAALQVQPDGSVKAMQLTDPGLMPYTSLAGMTVPAANPATAYVAPTPDQPNYMARLLVYVQAIVREPFLSTYSGSGGSVVWGLPTSSPATDPHNPNFVYQRFQNGILFYDATAGTTQALPLGVYLKELLTGQNLPAGIAAEAAGSALLGQYAASTAAFAPDAT